MAASSVFINRCVRETLAGVRDGLSLFSGLSRAAIIFTLRKESPLLICDPQNLLRGYEPIIESIFLDSTDWCRPIDHNLPYPAYNYIVSQPNLQLDGLISLGGSSYPVYYQMWFTEHHPNICSVRPTECWLEHAVLRFSHDMANDSTLYTGISGGFLKEYATHAVHDCVVDIAEENLGLDVQFQIHKILESVLGVSKTSEEGRRPFGALCFVEPRSMGKVPFLAKLKTSEQPLLKNYKHVRKMLQAVEDSTRVLVSDGQAIVGVAKYPLDVFSITADFQGKFGFLQAGSEIVCSFNDGGYSSNTHRAKLYEVEEALLDFPLEPESRTDIFKAISALVHNAEDRKFGCSFVLDLAENPTEIAGQALEEPLDLKSPEKLLLAAALSRLDGALHIRSDIRLHGFGCLLDGHRVDNEDRARGARYNSALRFTSQHPQTVVVVVSSDRPVSIFQGGKEIRSGSMHLTQKKCSLYPLQLRQWLHESE